jgi:DNA-binding IclR family transcriptional regulator
LPHQGTVVIADNEHVDDHARRMMQTFLDAVDDYRGRRSSLLDLSRCAGQTAATIDNASAPLPMLLERAESDLEYVHFAVPSEDRAVEVERIVRPILAALADHE